MAKTKISEYDSTANNNTDVASVNIDEGCAPSGINNAIRAVMAHLKDYQQGTNGDSFNGPVNGTIGATTPAAGTFTTLSTTGNTTLGNDSGDVITINGTTTFNQSVSISSGSFNGAIGSTTPSTGAFTTLSASSTATLNTLASSGATLTGGSINNMAIGGSTAAAGAFTTLSASGAVTLSGGTANGVAYLNGSKVLTSGSALTFNGTNAFVFGDGTSSSFTAARSSNGNTFIIRSGTGTDSALVLSGDNTTVSNFVALKAWNSSSYNEVGVYGNGSSGYAYFNLSGSERMRLTSTGLGIGTSSPSSYNASARNLVIANASGDSGITIHAGASSVANLLFTNAADVNVDGLIQYDNASNFMRFWTNGIERLRIDSSGNLGLGVTPSAWDTAGKAIQVGVGGAISGDTSTYSSMRVVSNGYYNSGWKYIVSSQGASRYEQYGGAHSWYTAASGTAGNAISFTQAMTLNASGNLGLGTTSPTTFAGYTFASLNGTNGSGIDFAVNGTGVGQIYTYSAGLRIESYSTNPMLFYTNGAERARINSSGNLLVGTTSAGAGLGTSRLAVEAAASNDAISAKSVTSANSSMNAWNTATTGNNSFVAFWTESSATLRGSITYNRTAGLTAYNTTSDYRAKDIIGYVHNSGDVIDSVPVYIGKMKGATQERPMFIAHETPPYAHTGEKDAVDADGNPVYQQMDASALVPVMWAEIQSLRKRLAAAGIA